MIEFKPHFSNIRMVDNGKGIGSFCKDEDIYQFEPYDYHLSSEHMRAAARKLDELNGIPVDNSGYDLKA